MDASLSARLPLRVGTRGSRLARIQTELAVAELAATEPALGEAGAVEVVVISTTGDRVQDRVLADIGGKGLFSKELDAALGDGRVDLAVHSMKDIETEMPAGVAVPAVLAREDPRDALVSAAARRIADLPQGAVVGTSSVRRRAQVLALRPDLRIVPIRGNVETRLRKLAEGEADATFLAMAGLIRLGRTEVGAPIPADEMVPSAGQGVIGIACRAGDDALAALLAPVDHPETRLRLTAERAALAALDGSCRTPIGAHAAIEGDRLRLDVVVADLEGRSVHRTHREGPVGDAAALGRDAGTELRARVDPAVFTGTG